jgi:hypothetical protein
LQLAVIVSTVVAVTSVVVFLLGYLIDNSTDD